MAELLGPLLPEGPVLAAGLGNPAMTPDALGPRTLDHLLICKKRKENSKNSLQFTESRAKILFCVEESVLARITGVRDGLLLGELAEV